MKTINFSCIEVLPALLDRTKLSTIRPAWKELYVHKLTDLLKNAKKAKPVLYIGQGKKPPRYKVGEEVKIYWKQRSKSNYFCSECGGVIIEFCDKSLIKRRGCKNLCGKTPFPKLLGTAKITEVFKIEMDKGECFQETGLHCVEGYTGNQCKELAKRDGFDSVKDMVKTLEKMYDLSSPKTFWVYRWKYA